MCYIVLFCMCMSPDIHHSSRLSVGSLLEIERGIFYDNVLSKSGQENITGLTKILHGLSFMGEI